MSTLTTHRLRRIGLAALVVVASVLAFTQPAAASEARTSISVPGQPATISYHPMTNTVVLTFPPGDHAGSLYKAPIERGLGWITTGKASMRLVAGAGCEQVDLHTATCATIKEPRLEFAKQAPQVRLG